MYKEAFTALIRSLKGEPISAREIDNIDKVKIIDLIGRIYSNNIDNTLEIRYNIALKIFKSSELAIYTVLKSLNLQKLYKLFIDKSIEDIILIPNKYIYLSTFIGKKSIKILADEGLVEPFLRLARAKGIRLLKSNPSFRYGLRIGPLKLRISVDLPSVVPSPQVYVRIHRDYRTLADLLSSGFMTQEQGREIRRIIGEMRNIIISGIPGSGKTTLLQAIDLEIPPWMQRVYIDEADEFMDIPFYNQIKINNINKIKEIFASMNRNIDLFILAELQYPEHFDAAKAAQGIGLWTLATMHAKSVEHAKARLSERGIELKDVAIIQLEKIYRDKIKRYIKEIYVK